MYNNVYIDDDYTRYFQQTFQLPKMEGFLNLMSGYLGGWVNSLT